MQQEGTSRIPWAILGIAWLMAFAMWVPMYCVPPMEHILKEELLLTHAQTSLLFTAPLLMIVAIAIPAGFIADRIGIRKAAGIGAIIIVIGTVLRGTASDASSLLAFTFIYGVGLGWSFPNLPKLVSGWAPQEKAGVATGIYTTGILTAPALALAITMPLIFPITNTFQGVFFIWSIPPVIAAILWWILAKDPPQERISSELVSGGGTLLRKVLRNKNLWLVASIFLLHDFFFHSWAAWAPTLMMFKGAPPELAGLITSVVVWVGIFAVFFMPRLAYKLGLRKPFLWIPGFVLALAAWGALHVTLPMSWPLMALIGFALETRFVTIIALPVEMMPKEEVGTASGLVFSVGLTGGVIGSFVGGRILDLTGSLDLALLILAGLSIAAAGIALRLPETGPKARERK
jgi:CP family cyanate transporter-like MFS transporter